jgi:hypothetical protein
VRELSEVSPGTLVIAEQISFRFAEENKLEDRPRWFAKALLAAHLIVNCKMLQKDAAKAVGRTDRSLREWMATPWWQYAIEAARELWYDDVQLDARFAVQSSVRAGNAEMGLKLLERLDPRMRPPVQRVQAKTEAEIAGAMMHGVVELPAESVGLESEEPEAFLEKLGRNLAAEAQAAATAGLPALPAISETNVSHGTHERGRSPKVQRVLERMKKKRAVAPPATRPATTRTQEILRRRPQEEEEVDDEL